MYPKHRYISNEVFRILVNKSCSIIYPDIECVIYPDVLKYPTQDQVIDWLEQEHKIFISTFPLYDFNKINHPVTNKYGVNIKDEKGIEYGCQKNYKTKEEAINAALLKVLNELI